MRRWILASILVMLLIAGFLCFLAWGRYQNALYWIDDGIFSKATSYVDEFPFLLNLFDPGIVSYAYAGEQMEYGNYEEAIELLKPLTEKNYRNSAQMLIQCMQKLDATGN